MYSGRPSRMGQTTGLGDFWLTITTPTPMFFVSVESKGLSDPVSSLSATLQQLTREFTSVDSKEGYVCPKNFLRARIRQGITPRFLAKSAEFHDSKRLPKNSLVQERARVCKLLIPKGPKNVQER